MKILICFFVLLVSLMVWASNSSGSKKPSWIDIPQKGCKKTELCAVGEGSGMMLAAANARKALAQVFKTKISSTFQATTTVENDDAQEQLSENVTEITEDVLDGVEIRETFQDEVMVYALAVLNKIKAGEIISRKIGEIDKEMEDLFNSGKNGIAAKLKKLYKRRLPLEERYYFLLAKKISSPVTYEQIAQKMRDAVKGIMLFVDISGKEEAEEIESMLAEYFTGSGYKVVRKEKDMEQATHLLKGSFVSEKQYLKVEGFEKYKFVFDLSAANKKGHKTGVFQFTTDVVGRDYSQSKSKAIGQLREYIQENLSELNIE